MNFHSLDGFSVEKVRFRQVKKECIGVRKFETELRKFAFFCRKRNETDYSMILIVYTENLVTQPANCTNK